MYSIPHCFILPELGFTDVTVNNDLAVHVHVYDDDDKHLAVLNATRTHLSGIKFLSLINVLPTSCTPKSKK